MSDSEIRDESPISSSKICLFALIMMWDAICPRNKSLDREKKVSKDWTFSPDDDDDDVLTTKLCLNRVINKQIKLRRKS